MAVIPEATRPFMSVKQVADYLNLNEKKVYTLVNEGKIPGTKVTGKWMFPRELIDHWILESSHGGVMTDRLVVAGSDDPLLYRMILKFAQDTRSHALISYTATGTRLGLDLLAANRVDASCIHWGPSEESHTRHPALLRQYNQHSRWVLIHAYRREQGLMYAADRWRGGEDASALLAAPLRWAMRQEGAGAQRYLKEIQARLGLEQLDLDTVGTAASEREAAAMIAMDQADVAPGARAAAREFGLGFAAFGWESFDIALRRDIYFRRLFQELLKRLKTSECRIIAEQLGGYDLSDSGRLVFGEE
ncbi:helix-turn-helix transcriptional regulator [uncultured Thiohalocapsa sp.]|uniref:helix-turn-helix transcriptional regulator n=1 Tax=uncultured Thiohalocapsa sp. TaxID=768990 RepID=UPI0025F4C1E1|nr:helix-turn-helix transcriptional regulator [uncultured Thiohalocapsa sp.]